MKRRDALRWRIVAAYVWLAFASCTLFSVIAALAVEGIEYRLVDDRLRQIAIWASPRHAGHLPVEMPAGVSFYHGEEIPLSLRNLPAGVQERSVDGIALHVLTGQDTQGPYVVVDHLTDYDHIESIVMAMIALGCFAFLALSLFLGRYMAKRFVAPIIELAAAVEHPGNVDEWPMLTREDELGVLAKAFANRSFELNKALQREKNFTGDVSHELRTPLTVVLGASEIIAQHSHNAVIDAANMRLYTAAQEATASINVLLMLARSAQVRPPQRVSLQALVQTLLENCQALLAQRAVALVVDIPNDVMLNVPAELLAAALGNLVKNACLYVTEGEIRLSLQDKFLLIEDTGPGLPEAVYAWTANSGTSASYPSMSFKPQPDLKPSLGLELVRRICEYLNIELRVFSKPGLGTRFELHLPPNMILSEAPERST